MNLELKIFHQLGALREGGEQEDEGAQDGVPVIAFCGGWMETGGGAKRHKEGEDSNWSSSLVARAR